MNNVFSIVTLTNEDDENIRFFCVGMPIDYDQLEYLNEAYDFFRLCWNHNVHVAVHGYTNAGLDNLNFEDSLRRVEENFDELLRGGQIKGIGVNTFTVDLKEAFTLKDEDEDEDDMEY